HVSPWMVSEPLGSCGLRPCVLVQAWPNVAAMRSQSLRSQLAGASTAGEFAVVVDPVCGGDTVSEARAASGVSSCMVGSCGVACGVVEAAADCGDDPCESLAGGDGFAGGVFPRVVRGALGDRGEQALV